MQLTKKGKGKKPMHATKTTNGKSTRARDAATAYGIAIPGPVVRDRLAGKMLAVKRLLADAATHWKEGVVVDEHRTTLRMRVPRAVEHSISALAMAHDKLTELLHEARDFSEAAGGK